MTLIVVVICFSCNKSDVISSQELISNSESDDQKQNEATWISIGSEKAIGFGFKFFVGHTVQQCGGTCIKIFGEYGHLDCRGFGNICKMKMTANYIEDEISGQEQLVVIELNAFGDELEYQFPDRSFFITNPNNNSELWLNIPEQLLIRDNINNPFVISNIWFSDKPELENH